MTPRFEVGEVAILDRSVSVWHGCEVEVIGPLEDRLIYPRIVGVGIPKVLCCYMVRCPDGGKGCAEPHELRKLQPPGERSEWDRCVWQPTQVRA